MKLRDKLIGKYGLDEMIAGYIGYDPAARDFCDTCPIRKKCDESVLTKCKDVILAYMDDEVEDGVPE